MLTRNYLLVLALITSVVYQCSALNSTINGQCPNVKNPVTSLRKRRHIAFPKGSTVSMTTSVVKTFMTHAPSGWFLVIEIDLAWHLPDAKIIAAGLRRKHHHRQKRELWDLLRNAFDMRNVNGRACIIRSICEAKYHLAPPGRSLVHDILRVVFLAPLHEEEFLDEMSPTYNELLDEDFCAKANDCPMSVLQFFLDLNKVKN